MLVITRRAAMLGCCATTAGCAHVDVKLASFMAPDHGVIAARLPPGYAVENKVLRNNGAAIGITYAHRTGNRVLALYCGGSGFHRSVEGAIPLQALALNADVVEFDYPGYGDSGGVPSTESVLDTAVAVYDHIFGLPTATARKRLLYGFSLGGMVVAQLAQDRHADAVVLEATAATVRGWVRSRVPWALRPLVKVRVEPQIAALDCVQALDHFPGRLLVLASRADEVVPARNSFQMAARLSQAGRNVRLVEFEGRRHGAIMRDPTFAGRFSDFIDRVEGRI
jgi:pimeloyl-ACP methyl ester carboxylesterase